MSLHLLFKITNSACTQMEALPLTGSVVNNASLCGQGTRTAIFLMLAWLSACDDTPQPPEMPDGIDFQVSSAEFTGELEVLGDEQFRYRGGVSLQSQYRKFGSYSGLSVSPDLSTLTAVGWGNWLTGALTYDAAGDLADFSLNRSYPLLDEWGTEITHAVDNDAEALFADGSSYYVGFEENNRVWRYDTIDTAATPIHMPQTILQDTPDWGGFSSVTGTHDGRFLALTEGGQDQDGNTKGWLWDSSADDPGGQIWLRAAKGWLPVDLTLLPDGDLLLVEVRVGTSGRYDTSRLSRIKRDDVVVGSVMNTDPLALLAPPNFDGRTEGIHAGRGANGETLSS